VRIRSAWIKSLRWCRHACIGVDVIVGLPVKRMSIFLEIVHFEWFDISYLHLTYSSVIIPSRCYEWLKPGKCARETVKCYGLSVKNVVLYESQLGTQTVLFWKCQQGRHSRIYWELRKSKTPWILELRRLQRINLTRIDEDGSVQILYRLV
jgi:threonylcarbamoyladenosine tRNA methylthiotransferase MtaB